MSPALAALLFVLSAAVAGVAVALVLWRVLVHPLLYPWCSCWLCTWGRG